jgi:hypothetical protein
MAPSSRANQKGKEAAAAPGCVGVFSFRQRSWAYLFRGAILTRKLNPLVLAPHVRHSLGKLDEQRIWLVDGSPYPKKYTLSRNIFTKISNILLSLYKIYNINCAFYNNGNFPKF